VGGALLSGPEAIALWMIGTKKVRLSDPLVCANFLAIFLIRMGVLKELYIDLYWIGFNKLLLLLLLFIYLNRGE